MQLDRALVEMALSGHWADRVQAGQALVDLVGDAEADTLLRALLLDPGDTAVIARTADSLLERGGVSAWRVFAGAWNLADPSQADHLSGALSGALFSASMSPSEAAALRDLIVELTTDPDENVRAGAAKLEPRIANVLPG